MVKEIFTYEELEQAFYRQVNEYKNDADRIPERDNSRKTIYNYAKELYNEKYSNALHTSVLDKYK